MQRSAGSSDSLAFCAHRYKEHTPVLFPPKQRLVNIQNDNLSFLAHYHATESKFPVHLHTAMETNKKCLHVEGEKTLN